MRLVTEQSALFLLQQNDSPALEVELSAVETNHTNTVREDEEPPPLPPRGESLGRCVTKDETVAAENCGKQYKKIYFKNALVT